ncbi:MAG TPA: tail fiber domain-containing protein, partial [Myxococcota bacterium]|nr:tail fiber domain-containing protein [Myxococcota bacterium]
GSSNAALGDNTLTYSTTGSRNVALGGNAGGNQTTGSDNIYIGNAGVAAENRQIKIGTVGTHLVTTIAGISGATSAGGIGVLVNASGVLGTTTSSARFKEDVRDMGDASDVLMRLRPVTFRYTEDAVGAEDAKTPQYGLIAEEVASVAPELVAQDLEGKPWSVKYHELPALLLSQAQKQQRTIEAQAAVIQSQRREIDALAARMARLESEAGAAGAGRGR